MKIPPSNQNPPSSAVEGQRSAVAGRLSVYLLGAPRIELAGRPAEPDTRKAVALLAYLAMTGEPHTRDTLATLLWPEHDQSSGRAALRRTLSALKTSINGYGLAISRETLGLDPEADIWVDARRFRTLPAECGEHDHPPTAFCSRCLPLLSAAADLYHGDFMAGFSLRDTALFDEWQYYQSEALRRELARVLERLIDCYQAEGEVQKALDHARRLLELDQLNESAHRQLMVLYALNGQRPEALRQYRACVRVLEQELGVTPLEETTALYEQILSGKWDAERWERGEAGTQGGGDAGVGQPESPSPPYAPGGALPLVGRTAEWRDLLTWYEAVKGNGRFLVLEGEAGVGKTRLAGAFLDYVRERGATTITAQCYQGESGLAYAPLVEALSEAVAHAADGWWRSLPDPWLAEATRLLPDLGLLRPDLPPPTPLDSPGTQSRFFEAITRLVLTLCGDEATGVLFLDDVQWADEATMNLLAYLVHRLPGRRLFVLITWRGEEVPGDHPLRRMLAGGDRAGRARLIPLQRLDEPAVLELVQAASPLMQNSGGLAQKLYHETEGLPFFLVEYLAMLPADSMPGDDAAGDFPMPGGVRDLLRSRLAAVSQTGRQLLSAAAVIGRFFDFDTLREASGRREEETIAALEELLAWGLVVEQTADRRPQTADRGLTTNDRLPAASYQQPSSSPLYDFTHEKLRELAYEETSLARRRLLHRRVAEALAGARPPTAGSARGRGFPPQFYWGAQIAYHYQQAGLEEEAAAYYKQAGDEARTLYANAEALAHYRSALALGYGDPAVVHEALGDLHTLRGEYDQALDSYGAAAAAAERLDRGADFSRIEHKLGTVYDRRGEWDLAAGHYEVALSELAGNGGRASLLTDWSLTAHHSGEDDKAIALAGEAMDLAQQADDAQAQAQAHNILGILAKSQGDLDGAARHLEQSLALAQELDDPWVTIAALNNLSLALLACGQAERAYELGEQALALCVALGDRHREAALHNNLADQLQQSGRTDEAMDHLKKSVAIYAEIGGAPGDWRPEIWKLTEW